MGQEQPRPDYNDEPELERTQPSPTRPPRRLDWRPPQFKGGGQEPKQQTPPVRRVQLPARRYRRPPTEGAPTWVVGLGIGALLAVIILLVVAFVFSRRSGEPEPSPTAVVVTPTRTLAPRPTATIPLVATATAGSEATTGAPATAPPSNTISVGGYVSVVAAAGLNMRQSPNTGAAVVDTLDTGAVLEVIGGPQQAEGITWWQLRTADDGLEGWSAAGSGADTYLEPASAP